MKISKYFTLAVVVITLMSFSEMHPKTEKDSLKVKQKTDSARVQKTKKKPAVKSGWLNQKNFPYYKESGCPFYIEPGC